MKNHHRTNLDGATIYNYMRRPRFRISLSDILTLALYALIAGVALGALSALI